MVILGEWLTGHLHCTTGLINLEAIQKNENGQRAKYLFHEKFSSKDDNEKMGLPKSWPRPLSTVELRLKTTPRGRVNVVPLYSSG